MACSILRKITLLMSSGYFNKLLVLYCGISFQKQVCLKIYILSHFIKIKNTIKASICKINTNINPVYESQSENI